MPNLFKRRTETSKDVAKERLKLVLVHDRSRLSPELVELIKEEIIGVISRHVEIDRMGMDVTVTRGESSDRLVANIPVKRPRG
ncbi:MAG: cell division topological specificity factor MinE [Chloroflexi bacterium]|nr:cell division topological specificity factor MinE [Chloroflexota bacterium]